ncbi:MAG: Uncharacterised protein [Hyphomonas sp. TMED17]|nr:MAG: Uncharacterised protein [Hyphomonas sp. TMED17]
MAAFEQIISTDPIAIEQARFIEIIGNAILNRNVVRIRTRGPEGCHSHGFENQIEIISGFVERIRNARPGRHRAALNRRCICNRVVQIVMIIAGLSKRG